MNDEISNFLKFLNASPTAWHAVSAMEAILARHGFERLDEKEEWALKPGGRYVVVRNGSSICAFTLPQKAVARCRLILSHTDSPAFKLKPHAEYIKDNMVMLGVEVYGSPLITSWLNRDLGIAGRVFHLDKQHNLAESLITLDRTPVVIPQLAVHLDRQVNEEGLLLHKQEHLAALAGLSSQLGYLSRAIFEAAHIQDVINSDLFLYPLEQAALMGEHMVAGYRIDNLCSVFASLQAIVTSDQSGHELNIIAALDNEEVGSETAQGVGSPYISHIIERITIALKMPRENYLRLLRNSSCLSVDMAHATHPSYADRHEPRHPVQLGGGVVFKFNAQQRYASDAYSASALMALCKRLDLPYQQFVTRGNIPCGTTVGPIHAAKTGMATVDIGIPQLSMHSCRELAACKDIMNLSTLLIGFFSDVI